jgi:hypothetical protein
MCEISFLSSMILYLILTDPAIQKSWRWRQYIPLLLLPGSVQQELKKLVSHLHYTKDDASSPTGKLDSPHQTVEGPMALTSYWRSKPSSAPVLRDRRHQGHHRVSRSLRGKALNISTVSLSRPLVGRLFSSAEAPALLQNTNQQERTARGPPSTILALLFEPRKQNVAFRKPFQLPLLRLVSCGNALERRLMMPA